MSDKDNDKDKKDGTEHSKQYRLDGTIIPVCGAKLKRGGHCQNKERLKGGKCRYHGGMSTGKKHISGLKAQLDKGLFTEEEVSFLEENDVGNIEKQLLEEIEIATIRLNRMLKKIQYYKDKEWVGSEKKDSIGQAGNQMITNSETTSISNDMLIQKIEADITKVQNQKMKLLNSLAAYRSTLTQNNNIDVSVFINAIKGDTQENKLWDDDSDDNAEDGSED